MKRLIFIASVIIFLLNCDYVCIPRSAFISSLACCSACSSSSCEKKLNSLEMMSRRSSSMPEQYSGMWNVLNLRRLAGDSWSQVEDTDTQHRVCTALVCRHRLLGSISWPLTILRRSYDTNYQNWWSQKLNTNSILQNILILLTCEWMYFPDNQFGAIARKNMFSYENIFWIDLVFNKDNMYVI